jgi:DNA-binding CsgD family transcriptional regulator
MPAFPHTVLTAPERRLLMLLAPGRTSVEAASALHLTPAEAEAMLEALLRRYGLSSRHQLFVRALVYRWI